MSLEILAGLAAIKNGITFDSPTTNGHDKTKNLVEKACLETIEFLSHKHPLNTSNSENIKRLKSKYIETLSVFKIRKNTALHVACNYNWTSISWLWNPGRINTLLQGLNPEQRINLLQIQKEDGWTALHVAAANKGADEINTLLKDLDPDQKFKLLQIQDDKGWTALHLTDYRYIIGTLLQGLDSEQKFKLLQIQEEDGETALHLTANKGTAEINALLQGITNEQKLDLYQIHNKDGKTALHLANYLYIIDALLQGLTNKQRRYLDQIKDKLKTL